MYCKPVSYSNKLHPKASNQEKLTVQPTPSQCHPKQLISLLLVAFGLMILCQPTDASIGYFEHYGWPTYGIVKPFWMTPFSAFPSRSISGYSRKHPMYNGRGILRFNDY